MATVTWTGNALDVKQISTITVANTWATGDTAILTINGKDIVVTVGATNTSTANVATAIKEAWDAATRLDGSGTTDATSNAGGQEFGEFAEASATVSGSVVTLVARVAGKPFTLTVTETTAGTGTATGATTQAATGKSFWNNADNWDTGSVPANDDIVVFRDTGESCKYSLPNGSLEVTLNIWMSYTGEVGLPAINRDNPQQPYHEYRQLYVRLDDSGTGTDIAHRFGIGKDGTGCRLFNLKHSTVKCSPIVYNTGTPLVDRVGTKALNICCTANTSAIQILGGSVDYSSQDGGASAYLSVYQTGGDSRGISAIHTTSAQLLIAGGTAIVGGSGAIDTIIVQNGSLRLENQTGTISNFSIYNGTVDYATTATITNLNISGGVFDARSGAGQFVVTNSSIYVGGSFIDPYRRMAQGNPTYMYLEPNNAIQFGASTIQAITVSTS